MEIIVTGYNTDRKITAIKGIRAVAQRNGLRECKDFIESDLPLRLTLAYGVSTEDALSVLADNDVRAQLASHPVPEVDQIRQLRKLRKELRDMRYTVPQSVAGTAVADACESLLAVEQKLVAHTGEKLVAAALDNYEQIG